jgi:outer membrane immunogenic protein
MAYMTGGLAIGEVKDTFAPFSCCSKSASKTRVGWTVGGGVETLLTQNWVFGVDALFVDLGQYSGPTFPSGPGKASKFSHQTVISRVRLNYKF